MFDLCDSYDSYDSYDTPESTEDTDDVNLDPDWNLNKSKKDGHCSKAPVSKRLAVLPSTSLLGETNLVRGSSFEKSAQSFQVMKNVLPSAKNTSTSSEDIKEDSDIENASKKQSHDNDNKKKQKRSNTKSLKAHVVKNVLHTAENASTSSEDKKEDSGSEKASKKQSNDNDNRKKQKRSNTKSSKAHVVKYFLPAAVNTSTSSEDKKVDSGSEKSLKRQNFGSDNDEEKSIKNNVQCLPAMGSVQQLQSGVTSMPENLRFPGGVPDIYTQTLRIPKQVPLQRPVWPRGRPFMNLKMGGTPTRGHNMSRAPRGRPITIYPPTMRDTPLKIPLSTTSVRHLTPPLKRVATDRNSFTNNTNENSSTIVKSLTKSIAAEKKFQVSPTRQDTNLTSKWGFTIRTVDAVNNVSIPARLSLNSAVSLIPTSLAKVPSKKPNEFPDKVDTVNNSISIPAGLSLNSAVSIIPTSPVTVPSSKKPHELPNKVSQEPSSVVVHKLIDTIDITGSDTPKNRWPCDNCSNTFLSIEKLYRHVSIAHKSVLLSYRCDLCSLSFPSGKLLNDHRQCYHKIKTSSNVPNVIPIINLNKNGVFDMLHSMGVTNYLPVVQLDHQDGQFGIPLMSSARPGSKDSELVFNNMFNLGCMWKL